MPGADDMSSATHYRELARLLIFRLGSIGDFVVALPCLHFLRARYPLAEIVLLTNAPVEIRAAAASSVLQGTGLVDRFIEYRAGRYDPREVVAAARKIRAVAPGRLVYLVDRPNALSVYRDYLFFRLCGIRSAVGFPFASDLRQPRLVDPSEGLYEKEAERLARSLASLGAIDCGAPRSWDLVLSKTETLEADRIVEEATPRGASGMPLIALSIGTKQPINDWGDANWRRVLELTAHAEMRLMLVGSREDRERSQAVARLWRGPVLNLCGRLSPRLSAAAMRRAELLMCHDSGPMHLAAAVGTRCVAVFSTKDAPGRWYPFGRDHVVHRPRARASGIDSIEPAAVAASVQSALERPRQRESDCGEATRAAR